MSEKIYHKLAKVLDTLPSGFPATDSGVEIELLKKVFTPEERDFFCDLRLDYETALDIARRTGRSLEGLEARLISMSEQGEILTVKLGKTRFFKMLPWIFGIFDLQLHRIDKEFAQLNREFYPVFGRQFFDKNPQFMQTIPVEQEISPNQEIAPYERVSNMIESSRSFMVFDCICKKEQGLLDNPCSKPHEVCMTFAPVPGIFDKSTYGRAISKKEAKAVLDRAEEAGLVHMTSNIQNGHFFLCNCCGCCCVILGAMNKLSIPARTAVNSHYYAVISADDCVSCGTCADERCQTNAIFEEEGSHKIIQEKCIGCGLCVKTCPEEAITLLRYEETDIQTI
jgi:Pyruvate/2-oxoacid:ferredoxin oxidoreductase delta subunit